MFEWAKLSDRSYRELWAVSPDNHWRARLSGIKSVKPFMAPEVYFEFVVGRVVPDAYPAGRLEITRIFRVPLVKEEDLGDMAHYPSHHAAGPSHVSWTEDSTTVTCRIESEEIVVQVDKNEKSDRR
jgi:hypothetical protein